jgi:hypothetical protein
LIEAALAHHEQVGRLPSSEELGKALDIDMPDEKLDHMTAESEAIVTARERIGSRNGAGDSNLTLHKVVRWKSSGPSIKRLSRPDAATIKARRCSV